MKTPLFIVLALGLILTESTSRTATQPGDDPKAGCEGPSREAMKVLDNFMAGFNSKDIKKFEATYNYPHVRLAGGKVVTLDRPSDRQEVFGRLQSGIGWDHSGYEDRKIIHCGPDKVHVAVRIARYDKDGKPIQTFDSLYVVTNQNGKWGIQMRSSYAGE
jgi:hypothetical protein